MTADVFGEVLVGVSRLGVAPYVALGVAPYVALGVARGGGGQIAVRVGAATERCLRADKSYVAVSARRAPCISAGRPTRGRAPKALHINV